MADNGRWFKLWCSAIGDPSLDNLSIENFGRWAKLGTYIKEHGSNGEIILSEPARKITSMMQLNTFSDVIECIKTFPNVTVSTVTNTSVSFLIRYKNWYKYQGDYSYDRVKKFRAKNNENETPKKRREEKRRDEIRKEENKEVYKEKEKSSRTKISDEEFIKALKNNIAFKGVDIDKELAKMDAWFLTPKGQGRKKTHGFILRWLNKCEREIKTDGGNEDERRLKKEAIDYSKYK